MFDNGYDRHTDYDYYSLFMKAGQNQRNLIADIYISDFYIYSGHIMYIRKIQILLSIYVDSDYFIAL